MNSKTKLNLLIGAATILTTMTYIDAMKKTRPYLKESVIVVDMNKNEIADKIPHKDTKAWFDFNGDGFANNTEWVKEDYILTYDANHDENIGYGVEFFYDKEIPKIDMLKKLDSNNDGFIDNKDETQRYIRLYNDKNSNGKIEKDELIYAANLSIDLSNEKIKIFEDNYRLFDTQLIASERFTKYSKDTSPDVDTILLPWLRGYGRVHDSKIQYLLSENFKAYSMQLMEKARATEGFEIEKDFKEWFKIWVGLKAVHDKYDVKREDFTPDDKVWILENLYGANVYKGKIEEGYSQKLVSKGENEDKYVSNHFAANFNRYESVFIYELLYTKKITGAFYNIGSDSLKVIDNTLFYRTFNDYLNSLENERDIRRIGKVMSYLNSPKEVLNPHLLVGIKPEVESVFMDEYNKYKWLR